MKVKIGLIEIVDPTMDELQELVQRFGGAFEVAAVGSGTHLEDRRHAGTNGQSHGSASPADRVVLERLVNAGTTGVPTQEVGEVLGRRGKAIRPGLINWAQRIGLVQEGGADPFEECRAEGTRRGVRLKPSLVPVAQKLLTNM
jgi:hypothetical protein